MPTPGRNRFEGSALVLEYDLHRRQRPADGCCTTDRPPPNIQKPLVAVGILQLHVDIPNDPLPALILPTLQDRLRRDYTDDNGTTPAAANAPTSFTTDPTA